ncbi:3-oxoacyl-ACP reductase [Nocardiopsis terrae]|uniref:NADP-dependent 3-hydroxy acid dehydrogenase YdfG n=1 Tax=Nocardiopsis terrae TaxID=372655 RepID=A0ABR9HNY0_9ACTN|nr:NADP-dependent 3-hydroxy acid dehydrogenase YdfG [Nocardiopsis terrae]GHC73101.1 3-oxoacyl-ACP reductase [Nocardiopsis terrae]
MDTAGNTANDHKVIVITGAGAGIGRVTARRLLGDGHSVVLAGRRRESLAETADGSPGATVAEADVTSAESVRALFGLVRERFGRVDVLFNNAGVFGPAASVDEIGDEDWREVLDTNVTGSLNCAREAARMMKEQEPRGGRIINNGSVSAHAPRPSSVAYTVSKHAVSGLTASMNLDLRGYGIACTQIDVGNAATAMTAGFGANARQADGSVRPEPTIDAVHVADTIAHIVSLPTDVNVPTVTVMAREMPFAGRG